MKCEALASRAPSQLWLRPPSVAARLCAAVFVVVAGATAWAPAQHGWTRRQVPGGRIGHGLAYDSVRRKVVLFGGASGVFDEPVSPETWEYDGKWVLRVTPVKPPARHDSRLVYDSARRRILLFGGLSGRRGPALADTWLYDGRSWRRHVTKSAPSARHGHSLAYDGRRGVVVLFGGKDRQGKPLDDTWIYNGNDWRLVQPVRNIRPPARYGHGLAFDVSRGRTVLFGGAQSNNRNLADTWEFDGTSWTQKVIVGGPAARHGLSLAYNAARKTVVLFGGARSRSSGDADMWEYGGTWRRVVTPTSPPGRHGHGLAYDSARNRLVLFGGGVVNLADTWEHDGTTWTARSSQTSPSERGDHVMAYDSARKKVVLFGGVGHGYYAETWEYDGIHWVRVATKSSPRAGRHAMAYDAARGRVILVPDNPSSPLETWEYDGRDWLRRNPTTAPPGRWDHSIVYDAMRQRIVLFGGRSVHGTLSDTWEYDGRTWIARRTNRAPVTTFGYTMAYDGSRGVVVLFPRTGADQAWEYDGKDWVLRRTTHRPRPWLTKNSLAYDSRRKRVVFVGGRFRFAETWAYDGKDWAEIKPAARPGERWNPALVYDSARDRLVLFGGQFASYEASDTWELLPPSGIASYDTFGAACRGSSGTPTLGHVGVPRLGTTLTVTLAHAPSRALLVHYFGLSRQTWGTLPLPFYLNPFGAPDCSLLVSAEVGIAMVATASGTSSVSYAIPNMTSLVACPFFNQFFVADAKANGAGFITSNAGLGIIGR